MKIDLTYYNTHFLLSILASILFLNLYIIYIISKVRNNAIFNNKNIHNSHKTDDNHIKRSIGKAKIIPKVNDDLSYLKREHLKDEDETFKNKQ